MNKFIQVNTEGLILSVASPTSPDYIPNLGFNPITGFYTFQVPYSLDDTELLKEKYYDLTSNTIMDLPERPAGIYYEWQNLSWVFNQQKFLEVLTSERNSLLAGSDWTQMPDSPLTTEQQAAWATYRQELRDITDNLTGSETTIEDAPWPTAP